MNNVTQSRQHCLDTLHKQYLVMIDTFEFDHYDCAVMLAGNVISNPGYVASIRADADWLKSLDVADLANYLVERGDRLDDCQPADDVEAAETQTADELG